ncbi:MAG: ECF transporter S component [Oscillibacter sp.]|jgi:riboflavin transporter FmnP|nr:ECF transporter S component [Oscillibacter sp.]
MFDFNNANALSTAGLRRKTNVKTLTSLAMLTALTYLAMLLSNLLPKVAGFLQMEIKGTVIAIGGFIFGPLSAAIISIVVAFIEMFTVSDTGIIGCVMNLLAACAFACPAAFIYQKMRTRKGAVIGLTVGIVVLTAVMLLWNYLITPIYMHMERSVVAAMLPTVFLPFNLVKGGLNMALTLLLYKPVVTALRKARLVPERESTQSSDRFDAGFLLFSFALLATFALLVLVLSGKI